MQPSWSSLPIRGSVPKQCFLIKFLKLSFVVVVVVVVVVVLVLVLVVRSEPRDLSDCRTPSVEPSYWEADTTTRKSP